MNRFFYVFFLLAIAPIFAYPQGLVAPDLAIEMEVSKYQVLFRRPIFYRITIQNNGNTKALGCILETEIPNGLEYISSTPQGAYRMAADHKQARILWKLGNFRPGQTVSSEFKLRTVKPGEYRTMARVISAGKSFEAYVDTRSYG